MSPAYNPGDRLIILPLLYGVPIPYTSRHTPQLVYPKRGDVILVINPRTTLKEWHVRIIQEMSEFFTGQRYSPFDSDGAVPDSHYMLRRIIAIPGDEVSIDESGIKVKPKGGTSFLTEEQIMPLHVEVSSPWRSVRWDSSRPFTGEEMGVLLMDDEYFVLSDDRSILEDSRTWGAINADFIRGRVSGRYYRKDDTTSE